MTGRLAAAALQFVDGTFQEPTQSQDLLDEAAVVLQQTEEQAALATGLIEVGSQWNSFYFMLRYYIA
jgi:hypothetical protein